MTARSDADMPACDRCLEQLDEWRRGTLAPDAVRELEEHLGECMECAEELAASEQLGQLLRDSSPASELPRNYMDDVSARVRDRLTQGKIVSLTDAPEPPRRRLIAPWWTAAAASILMVAGLAWIVSRPEREEAIAPARQVAYNYKADARSRAAAAPAPAPAEPTSILSESGRAKEEAPTGELRQQIPSASTEAEESNGFRFDDHQDFARAERKTPAGMAKASPPAQRSAGGKAMAADEIGSGSPTAAASVASAAPAAAPASPAAPEQSLSLAASALSEPQPVAGQTENLSTRRALDSPSRASVVKQDEVKKDETNAIYQRAEEARVAERFVEAIGLYDEAAKAAPGTAVAAKSQMRIGELALDHLNDEARAKAAFSACLTPPLREHLDPATLEKIRARLNSIEQR